MTPTLPQEIVNNIEKNSFIPTLGRGAYWTGEPQEYVLKSKTLMIAGLAYQAGLKDGKEEI